jgi:hypothetical protein
MPIAPAVRNDDLLASTDTTTSFQASRAIPNVWDKLGVGLDTSLRCISRGTNTPRKGRVNEEGGGKGKAVETDVLCWISRFQLQLGKNLASVLD